MVDREKMKLILAKIPGIENSRWSLRSASPVREQMAILCLFLDHEMILCKVESENGAGSLYVNAALHYFRKCTGPCQLHRKIFQINAKRLKIQRCNVRIYRQVKNG